MPAVLQSFVCFASVALVSSAVLAPLAAATPAHRTVASAPPSRDGESVVRSAGELAPGEGFLPLDVSCNADCNRRASDCIDGCEEKFRDDDKARVTCKFECTQKRQQCEKSCG
jgi:hypothetical protein